MCLGPIPTRDDHILPYSILLLYTLYNLLPAVTEHELVQVYRGFNP